MLRDGGVLRDSFCFWGLNKYYKIYRPQIVLFAKLRFLALTRALCELRRSHSIHLIADTKLSLNTPFYGNCFLRINIIFSFLNLSDSAFSSYFIGYTLWNVIIFPLNFIFYEMR